MKSKKQLEDGLFRMEELMRGAAENKVFAEKWMG